MSWTIYQTREQGDNASGITKLKDAIEYAGRKNVIMFCASEDRGFSSSEQPYPATDCNPNILKCVGAAGTYGERSQYVNPNHIDYLFPGEIAVAYKLSTGESRVSGSSAATALAAGLAGLILWCDALSAMKPGNSQSLSGSGKPLVRTASTSSMTDNTVSLNKTKSMKKTGTMQPPPPPPPLRISDFQTHKRMYGLLDKLRSSDENPFINVTPILNDAAKHVDPPARLIELCRETIHGLL